LKMLNVPAALNHPYPGDYILRRHGKAHKNVHAIQIEIDRSLYLDPDLREPGAGFESTAALVGELLFLLVELLGGQALPLAAE
jgi:N-formylglutamate amidohydrolase